MLQNICIMVLYRCRVNEKEIEMKYHILQVALTDKEVDMINDPDGKGHQAVGRHWRKTGLNFADGNEWNNIDVADYDHVADINANHLDHVWEIGNADIRRDENPAIDLLMNGPDKYMSSVSVGDLIVNAETKNVFAVRGMGFMKLNVPVEKVENLLYKDVDHVLEGVAV